MTMVLTDTVTILIGFELVARFKSNYANQITPLL